MWIFHNGYNAVQKKWFTTIINTLYIVLQHVGSLKGEYYSELWTCVQCDRSGLSTVVLSEEGSPSRQAGLHNAPPASRAPRWVLCFPTMSITLLSPWKLDVQCLPSSHIYVNWCLSSITWCWYLLPRNIGPCFKIQFHKLSVLSRHIIALHFINITLLSCKFWLWQHELMY